MNLEYIVISNCPDLKRKTDSQVNEIISNIFDKLNLSTSKGRKILEFTKTAYQKWNKQKN